MCHYVPYKKQTRIMKKYIVEGAVELLNYPPSNKSVSDIINPSMIVEAKGKIDMVLKMIEFGAYAMVYGWLINNTKRRSTPEIVLKATYET